MHITTSKLLQLMHMQQHRNFNKDLVYTLQQYGDFNVEKHQQFTFLLTYSPAVSTTK
jgi:hypothetical protein